MVDAIELKTAATLGFVAGLALGDALDAVVPSGRIAIAPDGGGVAGARGDRFELKWPNDVLADGAKLAGILLESALLPGSGYALAIGIGVNVVAHPDGLPYPATSLSALGSRADAETLTRTKGTRPYGYILKPCDDRELHLVIDCALYQHRTDQLLRHREHWLAATPNPCSQSGTT